MEEGMASKIAAAWRGYRCLVIYKSIVIGMSVVLCSSVENYYLSMSRSDLDSALLLMPATDVVLIQSVVRQFLAQRKVQAMCLRAERAAATMIQAKWRSVASAKQYVDTKSKVVLLQCFVRQMMATIRLNQLQEEKRVMQAAMATRISTAWRRAHCQAVFKNTVKSIIECQLIVRTFLAWKLLARLKHDVEVDAATCIQSEARGYLAREHFMKLKCSAIVVQSTARRLAAVRKLHYLRWRRILLKKDKATKIAAVWKGFRVRSSYILVLLGL
jgi:myosin heavy subunit